MSSRRYRRDPGGQRVGTRVRRQHVGGGARDPGVERRQHALTLTQRTWPGVDIAQGHALQRGKESIHPFAGRDGRSVGAAPKTSRSLDVLNLANALLKRRMAALVAVRAPSSVGDQCLGHGKS